MQVAVNEDTVKWLALGMLQCYPPPRSQTYIYICMVAAFAVLKWRSKCTYSLHIHIDTMRLEASLGMWGEGLRVSGDFWWLEWVLERSATVASSVRSISLTSATHNFCHPCRSKKEFWTHGVYGIFMCVKRYKPNGIYVLTLAYVSACDFFAYSIQSKSQPKSSGRKLYIVEWMYVSQCVASPKITSEIKYYIKYVDTSDLTTMLQ